MKYISSILLSLAAIFATHTALAQDGTAENYEIMMQNAASPTAEMMHEFHGFLLYIISGIVVFVSALLLYVLVRFNKKANPVPKQFTHNVLLEVIWTVIPVIILIVIAIPSFKLLYFGDRVQNPEMTLKVTGYQWYWGYEYPDYGDVSFQSYMIKDTEIDPAKGQKRLLSTDNPVVLPVDTDIQLLVTAGDVLHAWAMPSMGVKIDAVPGRLNETWVRITKPGTYYGQCSELCGKDHSFMPIEIHAVSKEEFNTWIVSQGGALPEAKAEESSDSTDAVNATDTDTATDTDSATEVPAGTSTESPVESPAETTAH